MGTRYKILATIALGLVVYQVYNASRSMDVFFWRSEPIRAERLVLTTSPPKGHPHCSETPPGLEPMRAERLVLTTSPPKGHPHCSETPPGLVGNSPANTTLYSREVLERKFSYLTLGGHYSPGDCRPAQRTAIIIPYRNRWDHLRILLNNLVPFLVRQQVSFTIFVIEQDLPGTFNRAMLLNIGFVEALKRDNYTCFLFHDVDLIPLNDRHYYRCGPKPMHMAVAISKFHYRLPYSDYCGGVMAVSRDQVEGTNGNSNVYFGWGGEDDDLYFRLTAKYKNIMRNPMKIARYLMIRHNLDKGNEMRRERLKLLDKWKERQSVDGLNSLVYSVNNVAEHLLYTWITVHINETIVMQKNGTGEQEFSRRLQVWLKMNPVLAGLSFYITFFICVVCSKCLLAYDMKKN